MNRFIAAWRALTAKNPGTSVALAPIPQEVAIPAALPAVVEPEDTPTEKALIRLALAQNIRFEEIENGKANFSKPRIVTHDEFSFSADDINMAIQALEADQNYFKKLKEEGVTDIAIPDKIPFTRYSQFSEFRNDKPTDRFSSEVYVGGVLQYQAIKEALTVDFIINEFNNNIAEFERGLRALSEASLPTPNSAPQITAQPA